VKEIPLTKGLFAQVDDEDFERISRYKWYASKQYECYYALRYSGDYRKRQTQSMHRDILQTEDSHIIVDHKDGNSLNNQKSNLRICSHAENIRNRNRKEKRNTSGYRGVCWHKRANKWVASIKVDGKRIHLGCFDDIKEAAESYNSAAKLHFGEFCGKLNVIV
jgi:hypothetical protein